MPLSERWRYWPNLTDDQFEYKSDVDPKYNCVAWVLGITNRFIDPDSELTWPVELEKNYSIETYVSYFKKQGFRICSDDKYDDNIIKIALYADEHGDFAHVAIQVNEKIWWSKMGRLDDIQHKTLNSLAATKQCGDYGNVYAYMCKSSSKK